MLIISGISFICSLLYGWFSACFLRSLATAAAAVRTFCGGRTLPSVCEGFFDLDFVAIEDKRLRVLVDGELQAVRDSKQELAKVFLTNMSVDVLEPKVCVSALFVVLSATSDSSIVRVVAYRALQ